jgi:DNA primase
LSREEKLDILIDILGGTSRASTEYLFSCPQCKHHKKKLSINLNKGFKCWICDYRSPSIRKLIKRYGSFGNLCKWDRLDGGVDLNLYEKYLKPKGEKTKEQLTLPPEYRSLINEHNHDSTVLEPLEYLRKRGVTKQDIYKWKIGYCPYGEYKKRIIIPSFNNDGDLDFFSGRSYDGNWMSYRNPSISKDIIFNQLNVDWDEDVILVEGPMDAIKAGNAIPLLGSSLKETSRLFQYIAMHNTDIYVALDSDARKKMYRLMNQMLFYDIEVYSVDIGEKKDVGEMNKEEFLMRKEKSEKIDHSSILRWKLND